MPIYEYRCTQCGQEFEYIQRMSEDAKTECEACEGKLERLISQSAFHLKGGGWYKDLYSSTKKDGAEGSKKGGEAKSEGGSKAKESSDTKEKPKEKKAETQGASTAKGGQT